MENPGRDNPGGQELDTSGLSCPLPVLKARKRLGEMAAGAQLTVIATDPKAETDIPEFCDAAGHRLVASRCEGGQLEFVIEKGPGRGASPVPGED